jgi:hypothetical protein
MKFQIFIYAFVLSYQNTLRLYSSDRFTAEKCLQHEAFIYLNQKRLSRAHQRP